jgi:hypothetical protein
MSALSSVTFQQKDAEHALRLLRLISNADKHLTISDCMAICEAIRVIEAYYLLYPNAVKEAQKARADAEYNASLL